LIRWRAASHSIGALPRPSSSGWFRSALAKARASAARATPGRERDRLVGERAAALEQPLEGVGGGGHRVLEGDEGGLGVATEPGEGGAERAGPRSASVFPA
jgi:hypothetical protein